MHAQSCRPFYQRTVAPDFPILPMARIEEFLRVDSGADVAVIQRMHDAAVTWGEGHTNHVFGLSTWEALFSMVTPFGPFPLRSLSINKFPFGAVTSVHQVVSGTLTAVSGTSTIRTYDGQVVLLPNTAPSPDYDTVYPAKVTFTAGYAEGGLPAQLAEGLLAHIAFMYENRGDVTGDYKAARGGIPDHTWDCYATFRRIPGV
jgi:uncharacterized phiE125 gp8 family phage protein